MKTSNMDYEKKYKEALEKIRSLHRDYNQISTLIDVKEELENIFPELAESEDEKIKQKLIEYHKAQAFFDGNPNNNHVKFVSWLEKQGEQNLVNTDLDELVIQLEETIGTSPHSRETIKDFFQRAVQKYMNCLRIANGEIGRLVDENYSLKEKQGEQKEIESTPIFRIGDILKRKGKDYTFRVDRIQGGCYHCDRNHGAFFPIEEQNNWELVEQKPAEWSEDDEEMIDSIIGNIKYLYSLGSCDNATVDKKVNWLKSLTNRALSQPKQEWSEEDEKTIHLACEFIRHHSNRNDSINGIDCPILIERLKSLKPQSHWKPSNEQMEALKFCIEHNIDNEGIFGSKVVKLFNELKKL